MFHLPPMLAWDSLHPLIIHFPIVLLLLAPLFVMISAALRPPKGRPYLIAALLILLLGTASLFVATSTGKAAGELAERGGGMDAVLANHEALASQTRLIFSGLSAVLFGIFWLPRVLKRPETRLFSAVLPMAYLAVYSVGLLLLVNTAHAGGRLVHEFGIHSMLPAVAGQAHAVPVPPLSEEKGSGFDRQEFSK